MASQVEYFVSGRVGNVVFYKRSGKWIARAAADEVKQSKATKSWSNVFGKASTAGKTLRALLAVILPDTQDKTLQNEFSGSIARSLKLLKANGMLPMGAIPELCDHHFNKKTAAKERLRVDIKVSKLSDELLQLYIPAFIPVRSISAPAHTRQVDIRICAASCQLQDGQAQGNAVHLLSVPYDDQPIGEQFIQLAVRTPTGSLVLTGIRIDYMLNKDKPVNNEAFKPSSIIDAAFY